MAALLIYTMKKKKNEPRQDWWLHLRHLTTLAQRENYVMDSTLDNKFSIQNKQTTKNLLTLYYC
jgi:hypothetical protein